MTSSTANAEGKMEGGGVEQQQEKKEDSGSVATGSTSHSSSIATSSLMRGSRGILYNNVSKYFDAMRYMCYTTQRRALPLQRIADLIIKTIIGVQLFSFSLEPSLFYSSETDRQLSFSEAPVPLKLLRVLRFSRGSPVPNMVWAIVTSCLALLLFLMEVTQILLIVKGRLGVRFLYTCLKLTNTAIPAEVILCCNAFFLWIQQSHQSGVDIFITVLCCISFLALLYKAVNYTLFAMDFRFSWNKSAESHPRMRYVIFFVTMLLIILDSGWSFAGKRVDFSFGEKLAQAILLCMCFAVLFVGQLFLMPYFSLKANEVMAALMFSQIVITSLQIFAVIFPTAGPWLLLTSIILVIPTSIIGLLCQRFLYKWINKQTDKFVQATLSNPSDEPVPCPFKLPMEYDIALRFIYNPKKGVGVTPEMIAKAEMLTASAVRRFPKSPFVYIVRATFKIEIQNDVRGTQESIGEGLLAKPMFDFNYQLYFLFQSLNGKDSESEDLAIDLAQAKLHHTLAKKAIGEFWSKVYRTKAGVDDSKALINAISTLDAHEQSAASTFKQLMANHPTSIQVMRAYAFFLSDIVDDKEQADELLGMANEFEDQMAHQRTLENKKKKKVEMANASSTSAPVANTKHKRSQLSKGTTVNVTEISDDEKDMTPLPGQMPSNPLASAMVPIMETVACGIGGATGADMKSDVTSVLDSDRNSNSNSPNGESRGKVLQFRSRIASSRSQGVLRIKLAAWGGLLVLFAVSIALVVFGSVLSSSLLKTNTEINNIMDLQAHIQDSLILLSSFNSSTTTTTSNATVDRLVADLDYEYQVMKQKLGDSEYYSGTTISLLMPLENTDPLETVQVNTTIWEGIDLTVYYIKKALIQSLNHPQQVNSSSSTAMTFLVLNLVQSIIDPVITATERSTDSQLSSMTTLQIVLWVLFGTSLVICVAAPLFGFTPTVITLWKERKAAFSLFGDLPKSSCANEMSKHTTELERMEKLYKSQQRINVSNRGRDIFNDVVLVYAVSMTLILCASLTSNSSTLYNVMSQPTYFHNLVAQYKHRISIFEMTFLAYQRTQGSLNHTWMTAQFEHAKQQYLDTSVDYTRLVKDLSKDNSNEILYTEPCPGEEDVDSCTGLFQLNKVLMAKATSIFYGGVANDVSLWGQTTVLYTASSEWMTQLAEYIETNDNDLQTNLSIAIYVALAVSIVVLFLAYLLTRPMFRSLEVQTMRSLQLLLDLPLSMLLSIDSIHHFLERGFSDYQSSSTSITKEHEQVTKAILEGSQDAIIMVNENMEISFFNPAAEEITEFKAAEVLGKSMIPLLDGVTGKNLQSAVEEFLYTVKGSNKIGKTDKKFKWGNADMEAEAGSMTTSITGKNKATSVPVLISGINTWSAGGVIQFAFFIKNIQQIKENQKQYDMLLRNILPAAIIETLRKDPEADVSAHFKSVTVFFADIVEFTPKAAKLSPQSLVGMLNTLFSGWDVLCVQHGIEKIKTIGDCYMCAAGVPVVSDDHATRMIKFAIAALQQLHEFNAEDHQWPQLQLRIGINTGPVVAGVIGKTKLQYDMWGDAVNIASRVESNGVANHIQISKTTYELVKDQFPFKSRGMIALKGKGDQECFLLDEEVIAMSTSTTPKPLKSLACGDESSTSLASLMQSVHTIGGGTSSAAAACVRQSAGALINTNNSITSTPLDSDRSGKAPLAMLIK